jgi:hypothetical protein
MAIDRSVTTIKGGDTEEERYIVRQDGFRVSDTCPEMPASRTCILVKYHALKAVGGRI